MKISKSINNVFNKLFPDIHKDNWLVIFLLSILVGVFTLLCIIAFFLPGGIIEQEETTIFVSGWLLTPAISILSVSIFNWIQSKFLKHVSNALQIFLATNSLLLGLLITLINLSWQFTHSLSLVTNLTYFSIPLVFLTNMLVIFLLKKIHQNLNGTVLWILTIIGALGFINFIGLFLYFDTTYSTPIKDVIIALLLARSGLATLSLLLKFKNPLNRKWLFLLDILIIGIIAITCFDPSFAIDPHHQNFYLGPANRVIQGGTMLVDTFSQYGNLCIYFLAWVISYTILPITYQGFSLLISILFVGQFLVIYAILVYLVKNRFYAILLLIISILMGFFSTLGVIQAFPSAGPFRFGLVYLLLAAILFRSRFLSFSKVCQVFEYSLVGIAFLWSLETFIYVGFFISRDLSF